MIVSPRKESACFRHHDTAPTGTPAAVTDQQVAAGVAVAIVAHTQRAAMAARLARQIGAECVVTDDGSLGSTVNHMRAWGFHLGNARTDSWCVVLEDDAVPVPGFRE